MLKNSFFFSSTDRWKEEEGATFKRRKGIIQRSSNRRRKFSFPFDYRSAGKYRISIRIDWKFTTNSNDLSNIRWALQFLLREIDRSFNELDHIFEEHHQNISKMNKRTKSEMFSLSTLFWRIKEKNDIASVLTCFHLTGCCWFGQFLFCWELSGLHQSLKISFSFLTSLSGKIS